MRRFILTLLTTFLIGYGANAQLKAVQTAIITTPTVQCESCKGRIESYLKRFDGVISTNVNVKKKETTVKYVTDRINAEIIKTAIANAGYDAAEIPANPDAYKRLPQCCKRPEDGGGMKKN